MAGDALSGFGQGATALGSLPIPGAEALSAVGSLLSAFGSAEERVENPFGVGDPHLPQRLLWGVPRHAEDQETQFSWLREAGDSFSILSDAVGLEQQFNDGRKLAAVRAAWEARGRNIGAMNGLELPLPPPAPLPALPIHLASSPPAVGGRFGPLSPGLHVATIPAPGTFRVVIGAHVAPWWHLLTLRVDEAERLLYRIRDQIAAHGNADPVFDGLARGSAAWATMAADWRAWRQALAVQAEAERRVEEQRQAIMAELAARGVVNPYLPPASPPTSIGHLAGYDATSIASYGTEDTRSSDLRAALLLTAAALAVVVTLR